MRKKETVQSKKPKTFVSERKPDQQNEEEIDKEIQRQLQNRVAAAAATRREEVPVALGMPEVSAHPEPVEKRTYSNQTQNVQDVARGSNSSSKKVVKKRVVKMMKDGKLVAEKEEILDEEGNIIKTQIRKEGLGEE